MAGLLLDDVLGQVQHVLGDFDVLDVVKILSVVTLVAGSSAMMCSRLVNTTGAIVNLSSERMVSRYGIGVVADLASGHDVVRTDKIGIVDLAARHELVDLDGAGGLQRDVFEFVQLDLFAGVSVDPSSTGCGCRSSC
jgi:hypothetical protein